MSGVSVLQVRGASLNDDIRCKDEECKKTDAVCYAVHGLVSVDQGGSCLESGLP